MSDNKELVVEAGSSGRGGSIVFSGARGALVFEKFGEMIDFSLYMSKSDKAVPAFLRGNPGTCMAITVQASEWGFSPFAVARMAYVVNDQIAYMSQLIHSVVEKRANLKQRLRPTYTGEGPDRQITISGHFVGEVDPLEYTSPKIRDIKIKNSPLWTGDPDQQLFYFGSRAWARRYCPDVLLGVYAEDELPGTATQHVGAENAKDVTPEEQGLHHRLSAKAAAKAGFDPGGVAATLSEASSRPAEQNSPASIRTVAGAQAAVSNPTSPAGIVQTAADSSPAGDTVGHGVPSSEAAAATPTAAAAETPKRRGRPPKALVEQTQGSSESVSPDLSAPAVNSPAPEATTGEDPVVAEASEPPHDPEPGEVHVEPQETVVWEDPPPAENEIDDELPDDGLSVDRVPDPPVPPMPDIPTDGRYYCGWVRVMLLQEKLPSYEDPDNEWWYMNVEVHVRKWWGSFPQKKLRNGLPNYTAEVSQKAIDIVTERIKALKGV